MRASISHLGYRHSLLRGLPASLFGPKVYSPHSSQSDPVKVPATACHCSAQAPLWLLNLPGAKAQDLPHPVTSSILAKSKSSPTSEPLCLLVTLPVMHLLFPRNPQAWLLEYQKAFLDDLR